ncbi:MAG: T9SS type A sorting domain-containing protein [Bacteroidales bacterium]|nr:T9SS type A sorting domain-containing protein [Bacteroidales bacterium]
MKNILLLAILFSGLTLNAQVTQEHSYSYSGTLAEIDEGEYKYYVMDVPLNECRIYNEDHTLYKTISLTVPAGYYLYDIQFVSRKTFNTDELIELLYIYYKVEVINSYSVNVYGMKVVNESGTELMSLTDGGYAELIKGSNGMKLLAYQYVFYDSYYLVYTNVYTLGGTTKSVPLQPENRLSIYPNPVTGILNVDIDPVMVRHGGKLEISDMSGRKLVRQPLQPGINRVDMEHVNAPAGTYFLNIIPGEGAQVTSKIIKH